MADPNLKDMLKKVLAADGGKSFHFAYGTGKRTQGKPGDGALRLASKKMKKADLEDACECSQFYVGRCWAKGGTILFAAEGKKLPATLVTKMMLSAKLDAGQAFEFALPSEEDEAKQAKLDLAGGQSEGGEHETEQTPPPQSSTTPPTPSPAAEYQTALKELTPDLKHALALGGPTADEIKQIFARANALAQQTDYKAATLLLAQLRHRVDEALLTAPTDGTAPAPEKPEPPDLGLWNAARATAIKQIRALQAELLQLRHPDSIAVAKMLEEVPARLKTELTSRQAVEELEKYVREEELITHADSPNPWGVKVDIRGALLSTLGVVKAQFPN